MIMKWFLEKIRGPGKPMKNTPRYIEASIYHSYFKCNRCGHNWTIKLPALGADSCEECGTIMSPWLFVKME